jgi:threonine dehydratase
LGAPGEQVFGVEAEDAAGMTTSLQAGHVVALDHVGLFADGAAVRIVGTETFRVCQQLVDGMVGRGRAARRLVWCTSCVLNFFGGTGQVTVSTDEICAAIKAGFQDTRRVRDPTYPSL